MSKRQHIVPKDDQWGVRGENNSRLTSIHDTKAEAVQAGREIARNQHSELIIHGRNGKIQGSDSYGNDPCPPKDKR